MKRILSFISLLVFSISITAQIHDPELISEISFLKPGESKIGINLNYYLSSNSLNGSFIRAFYHGDYLDESLKSSVKLNDNNSFGSASNYSFNYAFRPSGDSLRNSPIYYLGISDKKFLDLSFNNDYFNLLFYGNSNLPEVSLKGFNFNYLNYQKIFAGVLNNFSFRNINFNLYTSLSLLKGQKYYSMKINDGYVNTSEYGQEISMGIDYNYYSSDTSNYNFTSWNGTGISADLSLEITNNKRTSGVTVGIFDFGKIFWNSESFKASADTSFQYSGLEVSNLIDFSFTDFSELYEDSLLDEFYYSKSKKGSFNMFIPARTFITIYHYIEPVKSGFTAGLQYILNSNMNTPFVYLRSDTKINSALSGLVQISTGGYSGLQIGLGVKLNLKDKLFFSLFSSNPAGFLDGESLYSQHANFSAYYKF